MLDLKKSDPMDLGQDPCRKYPKDSFRTRSWQLKNKSAGLKDPTDPAQH